MKLLNCILTVLFLPAVVTAEERQDHEMNAEMELVIHSRSKNPKYTFERYLSDVVAAARPDQEKPDNPVTQLAHNERKEYKPLNPIRFRW